MYGATFLAVKTSGELHGQVRAHRPAWTCYVFRQRLSPADFQPPALLIRQANGRADVSREGGTPTG